jgi:hypothetical protein
MNYALQLAGFSSPEEVRSLVQRHALVGGARPSRLQELEVTIERGRKTFVEVGLALAEIRDARLYRYQYATFEDYCRERWNWSRSYAHRIIEAAATSETLPPDQRPATESQARELARIEPERRLEVLNQVRATGKVTAAAIRRAARGDHAAKNGTNAANGNGNGQLHHEAHGPSLAELAGQVREELLVASADLATIADAIHHGELDAAALNQCADELTRMVKLLHRLARAAAAG